MTDLELAAVAYRAALREFQKAGLVADQRYMAVVAAEQWSGPTYQQVQDWETAKLEAANARHLLHVALAELCTAALLVPEVL